MVYELVTLSSSPLPCFPALLIWEGYCLFCGSITTNFTIRGVAKNVARIGSVAEHTYLCQLNVRVELHSHFACAATQGTPNV